MRGSKVINLKISLLMSLVISCGLSLAGNLASGHFTVVGWLITFAMSYVVALIIGLVVPIKRVCDFFVSKAGLTEKRIGNLLLSSLVSSIIYTPLITFLMVLFSVNMASVQANKQADSIELQRESVVAEIESIENQIDEYQSEYEISNDDEVLSQIESLVEKKTNLTNQSNGMQIAADSARSSVAKLSTTYPKSLALCFSLGFILILIFQPIIVKNILKRARKTVSQ